MLKVLNLSTGQRAESFLSINIFIFPFSYEKVAISSLRESYCIDSTKLWPPHNIGWIKSTSLKFSQLRDMVHRIRSPYLFHSEMLQIFYCSDFYWLCFD